MGLLDELLAGAAAGGQGGGRSQRAPAGGGAGMNNSVLMALLPVILSMLASRGGAGPSTGAGGGLGDLLGQVLGGGGAAGRGADMGDILGQVLGGGARSGAGGMGGLGELLESLQRAGHGDAARSWVGSGENVPISPDVIGQVFGRGGLEAIARQAGVSEAEASEGLSQLLPEVVDRVTPNGDVPDLDSLVASVDQMSRRYGLR